MKKAPKSFKRKCFYVIGYVIFMAITIILGMATDVWDDQEFKNL